MNQNAQRYLAHLGFSIIRWNELEHFLLAIVQVLLKTENSQFFILQMSTLAQCNSLRALADECGDASLKDHIFHLTDYFSLLREYRNFYVHGVTDETSEGEQQVSGIVKSYNLRGRVTLYRNVISESDLLAFIHNCEDLLYYIGRVSFGLMRAEINETGPKPYIRAPALEQCKKPPLPSKLKKLSYSGNF